MNTHTDTRSEDLIDLGAVKAETRGPLQVGIADDPLTPDQCFQAGLQAD